MRYSLTKISNYEKVNFKFLAISFSALALQAQSDQTIKVAQFPDGSAAYAKTITATPDDGSGNKSYTLDGIVGTESQMSIHPNNDPAGEENKPDYSGWHVTAVVGDDDNPGHVCVECGKDGPGCCNCDLVLVLTSIQNAVTLVDGSVLYSNFASYITDANGTVIGVSGKGDVSSSNGKFPSYVDTDGSTYYDLKGTSMVNQEAVIMNTPTSHNDLNW